MIEELQGNASELEEKINELGATAEEHKEDVLFLYKKIMEALPYCTLEAYKILSEVKTLEFLAIEEKRKEEAK